MTERELLELIAKKVASMETDLSEMKGNIAVLKNDVKDLKGNIAVLKDDVKDLKGDVAVLKDDVKDLKGDVAVLKDDVKDLKGDVAVLKDDVKDLKGDVAVLKNDVKDLKQTQDVIMEQTAGLTEFRASASNALENCNDFHRVLESEADGIGGRSISAEKEDILAFTNLYYFSFLSVIVIIPMHNEVANSPSSPHHKQPG